MTTNTLPGSGLSLGGFLRDRRARLSPGPDAQSRRRTPGLRREEVAARACVSVTWYTWLEQGRGGSPSDEVLERLVRALELDATGREVLFLLAQQRPPPLKPTPASPVSASLQRVLDAFTTGPAFVKTTTWDIVAWNVAALAVLANYVELPPAERNTLRMIFRPGAASLRNDWEADARFAIAAFRLGVARAGDSPEAAALIAELHDASADFRRLWAENDVENHWDGQKHLHHPQAGLLAFEASAFAVDGADGLTMILFNPSTAADAAAVAKLLLDGPK